MSGTSSVTMLKAVMIFFSSCLISIILATIGGSVLDILSNQFYNMGWYDLPSEWDSPINIANIYYAVIYILPIIGIYILFVTIYQRYRTDQDDEYDYNSYMIQGGRM